MNLSQRAKSLMVRLRQEQRPEIETSDQILAVFAAKGLPRIGAFVDCLQKVGGLRFKNPFTCLYFHSLPQVLGPNDKSGPDIYVCNGAWWFYCLELKGPCAGTMHESGSLHMDCDLDDPYASCLEKVIEKSALLDSLNFEKKVTQAVAVIKAASVREAAEIVGGHVDSYATDISSAYCVRNDGFVILLRTHKVKNDGLYGIRALLTSEAGIEDLKRSIGDSAISFSILE